MCAVWAEKTKGVECATKSTCDTGPYDGDGADALIEKLAKDTDVVVIRAVDFNLRSGERIRFEP